MSDSTAVVNKLKANTATDKLILTFIYHNDTNILDTYYSDGTNGGLVAHYSTTLTGAATSVSMTSVGADGSFLDWNYGVKGSDAYNAICDTVGVHTWNEGEVTTEATSDADGVKTYTCTVCNKTKTEKIHTDANSDGKCDVCSEGMILYTFDFAFKTEVPYSTQIGRIKVTKNGTAVTLSNCQILAAPGDVFVFTLINKETNANIYMPVTITLGNDTNVEVAFVRAYAELSNVTYDAANKTVTCSTGTNGGQGKLFGWKSGKDWAVQVKIDPKNIEAWKTYGIQFYGADGETNKWNSFLCYGFSRRSNTYDNNTWNWGFGSNNYYINGTSKGNDWGSTKGLFCSDRCGQDLSAVVKQLAEQTLDEIVLTYAYDNDKHTLSCYFNGIKVIDYVDELPGTNNNVFLISTSGSTTYLDWNYGYAGSAAYNAIIAQLTEKKS